MVEIIMPKLGDAMTEGRVLRWHKKAGEPVKRGEPVLEIETDKDNIDLEAEADGILGAIEVEAGQMVPVGTVLGTIGSGDGTDTRKAPEKKAEAAAPEKGRHRSGERGVHERKTAEQMAPVVAEGDRPRSSPLARKVASKLGVDIRRVAGSGPNGRVVVSDVESAAKEQAAMPQPIRVPTAPVPAIETKVVPLTAMRRAIARRLGESLGPVPHFFLTIEADVTRLLEARQQIEEITGSKVSVNDFVIRAAALSLRHHPAVNSSFGEEAITQYAEIHVGIAVATPEGLLTPVVRNADKLSVADVAAQVRALAEKARSRRLTPDEYQGSTFTISNLGMYGIEEFSAIINPPNAAILAVGAAMQKPVAVGGQVVVRDRMRVTMSCDHRVVDGATGAEYLRTLKQYLEQPLRLLV